MRLEKYKTKQVTPLLKEPKEASHILGYLDIGQNITVVDRWNEYLYTGLAYIHEMYLEFLYD